MIRTQDGELVYYQFETLQTQPGLRHAFFTRLGGVSRPPYASLNVGASVGDDPQVVTENRKRCFAALGLSEAQVVSPRQVHGATVVRAGRAEGGRAIDATDGLVTAEDGVALFLRFADCVPIMLLDRQRRAIGLVHAGWKGTLGAIAAHAVAAMARHFGSQPGQLWAGIGPSIGPCCYEVAADLAREFGEHFGANVLSHAHGSVPHLDLRAANRMVLEAAGVREVAQAALCTACRTDEFYSHRREGGRTGRLGVLLGLGG